MHEIFIRFSVQKLLQLSEQIDTCLARLSPEQIWWREAEAQNAVGNLVLHLCGNLGQWILSGVGGAPDHRQRDAEFSVRGDAGADELRALLRERVSAAADIIRSLSEDRLLQETRIQKYHLTVLEAVYHVVEHFSQHMGQIAYATKLLTRKDLGFYSHLSQGSHSEQTP